MLGLFCCWTLLSKMGISNDSRAMKLDFESILDIFQLDVWMDLFDSLLRVVGVISTALYDSREMKFDPKLFLDIFKLEV